MHGPATAGWLLVALCAGAGGYCLLRMRAAVGEARGTAGGEALMGFGMAAMAVPTAALSPPRWVWLGYAAVFGAAALGAAVRARSSPHHAHHLLGMLAMVYMAGAMALTPGGAHGVHAAAGVPLVTGGLLLYYTAYVLRAGARLLPLPAAAEPGGAVSGGPAGVVGAGRGEWPELTLVCRLSMGLAMLAMLLGL
ncbi:DUF5134 domain-containing protein [Streptomyces liangshanensis]|uniref:DUF5134 domain-containing protein n=1 Tax=Streptomyces liangshanensis TaxID=2717324 RepID=A0A6G9H6Y0_9ACTN|nr:DUF5134 domain-containing protein [Streptomyces liangshanensis]QIQ06204.1 DUF5134 domain-containing protein [Streptomyces liangshanensis]